MRNHSFTWEGHIQKVVLAYNSSIQPTTGHTPFYLMFGREARRLVDLMYGSSPDTFTSPPQYASQLAATLQEAYACVKVPMQIEHRHQKEL